MENELKDLKSVLRSIVVSSPAQVDVRSLQRDYKNMMGVPIPIAKYGYRDVLAFLKERCSDCFLFQGLPSNPVLTLIVPDSLKHIDQFVQKQKPSAITKMKGKRRSVHDTYSSSPEKPNLICETFTKNHVLTQKSTQHLNCSKPEVKSPDINTHKSTSKPIISSSKPSYINHNSTKELTESSKSTPSIKSHNENANLHSHVEENGHNGSVRDFYKKRTPMYDRSQYPDSEDCSDPDKGSSKGDNDSGRQTSSSQSSTKKAQLEELKREIYELIKEHEDGILCTDILRLYRERYSRELNLTRFGHNNINGVLCALEERVWFCNTASGTRVRAAAGPGGPPGPAPPRARLLSRPVSLRALPVDPDDALPGIDFEPDVFPSDCMHFMESIPALALRAVGAGAMLEVAVGEVYSPSHFWLQLLGAHHKQAMDDLMDEMAAYYNNGEGRERVLSRGAVRAGHYCSSLYDRDWHRSLIVKVLDADTVKVRHVDYGTVDTVGVSSLKPLLRRWARLPAQAVRARLAGLRPGAGGRRWPHAAAAHFLHLVRDKNFVANVVAVDPEEDTLETFLIDTSGADDVCVSSEMIRAGHADARADSALRTGECYLYPRFEALESGATPNFAEIHRYLADGINLEYVDAYRRYVPTALPAPRTPPPPPPPPPVEVLNRIPLLRLDDPPAPSPAASPPLTERSPPASTPPAPAPSAPTPPAPAATAATHSVQALAPSMPRVPATAASTQPIQTAPASTSPAPTDATSTPPALAVPAPTLPAPATTTPTHPTPTPSGPTPPAPTPPAPTPPVQKYPAPPRVPVMPMTWRAPPPPWGEVRLSLQECDMYWMLSAMDPEAAHFYMLSALRRATAAAAQTPRPPFPLSPHAPEFRASYPPPPQFGPPGAPVPRFAPPHPSYMRPTRAPPGF